MSAAGSFGPGSFPDEERELSPLGRLARGRIVPAVVAALLLWMSFAPVGLGWICAPLGWAVLLLSIRLRNGEWAGRQTFLVGLWFTLASLFWLSPLNFPMWIFVSVWCAGFDALFGWLVGRFLAGGTLGRSSWWIFAAPCLRLLADMLLSVVMTGFPWFLTGYTQVDNPILLGSADLIGVHGATFAVFALACGLAEAGARTLEFTAGRVRPIFPALGLWALLAAWSGATSALETHPGPRLLLLQGNLSQQLKEDRERSGAASFTYEGWLGLHLDLIDQGWEASMKQGRTIDAVVWPETMYPLLREEFVVRPADNPRNTKLWHRIASQSRGAYTLVGMPTRTSSGGRPERRNSIVAVSPGGDVLGIQDKQHLTPGGEYLPLVGLMPFQERFERWVEGWAGFVPDLRPGEGPVLLPIGDEPRRERAGVLICYESIYPELGREMAANGAGFLVNASNYGWFAETSMMDQSLAMARFRAAEVRRSVVSASNNGISAVIGPNGEIRSILTDAGGRHSDIQGYLLADVPICASTAPFTNWGEGAAWLIGGFGVVLLLIARRQPGQLDAR